MFYWILHELLQLPLDVRQASNIIPRDIGHLDDRLTKR